MRIFISFLAAVGLFMPTTIVAQERYQVSVTRKDQNLYKVDNQPFWVKTRYCYEYVYYEDAVLSSYSIVFLDSGSKCDVEGVLEETRINAGNYEVSVSREDGDLYTTLDGFTFKTTYCFEFVFAYDAIYRSSGYGGGSLHFLNSGKKCEVEQVFKKAHI